MSICLARILPVVAVAIVYVADVTYVARDGKARHHYRFHF